MITVKIKRKFFHAMLAMSVLLSACSGKPALREYAVNGYSISVPKDFIDDNLHPERFSFFCYGERDFVDISIEGDLEDDRRAGYEQRRMRDGTLEQYPYTLKGFSDFYVNDFRRWEDFKEINRRETTINQMPAVINEMQCTMTARGMNYPIHVYVASVQGSDDILYRIMVFSRKGEIDYADEVFQSFRLTE